MKVIRSALICALVLAVPSIGSAQTQVPANFFGVTSLELSPAGDGGGAVDDLITARYHKGHAAADFKPALNSSAAAAASPAATIPIVKPQKVVPGSESVSGFAGLSHFDQRFAGTGSYVNTQFSLEPPDQGLCAGAGFVVEPINNAIAVYDRHGNRVGGPKALSQFWGLAPEVIRSSPPVYGQFISDPRCYYDQATGRWFVSELEIDTNAATGVRGGHSSILIAVSATSDPTGAYYLFSFDTTDGDGSKPGHPSCPCFGDQPLIGADAYGFYVSTNEFPISGPGFNGSQVYALSKAALVAGRAPTVISFDVGAVPVPPPDQVNGGIWYSVSPATSPGPATRSAPGVEYFLSSLQFGPAPFDNRVAVWALTGTQSLDRQEPHLKLRHTVISSESYGMSDAFAAPQKPGPTPLRDALGDTDPISQLSADGDNMNWVVFQGGDLWSAVNTNVSVGGQTRQGLAWFRVTPTLNEEDDLSAQIDHQGYVAVQGEDVIYPSIAVNQKGRALITFTLAGPDYWPSAAYASLSNQAGNVHVAGAGVGPDDGFTAYAAYGGAGIGRWGDYTAAVADEDGDLWFAAEFIGQTCTLAQFLVDSTCGGTRSLLANWGTFIARLSTDN